MNEEKEKDSRIMPAILLGVVTGVIIGYIITVRLFMHLEIFPRDAWVANEISPKYPSLVVWEDKQYIIRERAALK